MALSKQELKRGAVVYAITFALCAIVTVLRYFSSVDIMSPTVFKSKLLADLMGESAAYSLWPISHFVLYLVLGYVAPHWWWLWFCIGVAWELFEYGCVQLVYNLKSNEGTSKLGKEAERMFTPQYGDEWVSGRKSDILFNAGGLIVGVVLSRLCAKN